MAMLAITPPSRKFAQLLSIRPPRADLTFAPLHQLTPSPDVEAELARLEWIDRLETNQPCAYASFGHECNVFWRVHNLKPLVVPLPPDANAGTKLQLREVLLNDICHVLLGVSRDWVGRLTMCSFMAAQNYCPEFEQHARRFAQICTTAMPWLREDFAYAEMSGRRLGKNVPRLLTMPLDQDWNTPLLALRDRLKIRKVRTLRSILEFGPQAA
jgi:hypothetical protein